MAGRIPVLSEDALYVTAESKTIDRLGNDPAQWIVFLNDLEKVKNEYRKVKLLGCFFSRAHRHLNSRELAQNESFAILLGREAMFHGNVSIDHARLKFESAILVCQLPIIRLMYAQFELNCGNQSKAMGILCQAKLDFGDTPEIQTAIKKVIDGRLDVYSDNIGSGQKLLWAGTKHESIEPVNTASQRKERNTMDLSESSLHNLSISTPKLNKDGTARLLRRQKDLVSVIDQYDNPHPAKTQSPVTVSSPIVFDIGLQSPVAPDLSMLSREFQPSTTLRLLETAKECHQKSRQSPVLKPVENKRGNFICDVPRNTQTGSISNKIALSNLSSHKKFLQGPQRVLRVSKQDSDDDSPKKPSNMPNADKENIKSTSGNAIESNGIKVTTQHIGSTPSSVPGSVAAIVERKTALSIGQSSGSAFKPPVKVQAKATIDLKLDDDKENKVPQFLNNKSNTSFERKIPNIPVSHVDLPSVHDKKATIPSLTLREADSHGKMKVPPTAAELIQDRKVLCVNGVCYIVLKILGKGGSSKVYQAYDPKTSQIVAVKQVNLTDDDEQVLVGYKKEINFLTDLQGSQYIVKLIDYELKEQYLYVVMECGSSDLSVFLKNQKASGASLDLIAIKMLWKNMLCAVKAIHGRGIIHLDLKPANFMFVDCNLKLIDFGIANSIQADATSVIKDTQFGTLNYMAPEMINDMSGGVQSGSSYQPKFKVGPKADVWSLGCILYYIIYGKTPFQHIHHQAMKLFAITNENNKIDFPSFPIPELVEVVQVCLVRDPKKRPSVEMLLNHPILS